MRIKVAWLGALGLVAIVAVIVICLFTKAATRCDFNYRLAEVDCVRQAVDPFRVWNEEVEVRPYFSNNPHRHNAIPEGCSEPISVYVPWEYTLMLPFSLIDKNAAWWIYSGVSMLALLMLIVISAKKGFDGGSRAGAVICASFPIVAVAHALWSNAQVGNHMAIVLLAACLMAHCLNHGKEVAAGVCWTIMMIKPQIGLPFAIPIMMKMKFRTALVAVGTCLMLALYPAIHCHASIIDMILEPSVASAFAFEGCGTMPRLLCGQTLNDSDILAGLAIGALACIVMTWKLRNESDWFVLLMPAAVTSCCWTYTQAYSHAMGWFLVFVIVRELLKRPTSIPMWILAGLAAMSLPHWVLAWRGFSSFFGLSFPMSEYAFRCVDTFNSTFTLAIAWFFCPLLVKAKVNMI